jgi:rubrerythrin
MRDMTLGNLQSAFAGESQAHMRYLIYADKAAQDGFPTVARLFRAIAYAEQVHATNHFRHMRDERGAALTVAHAGFGLGPTAQNLEIAIGGEEFEVNEMYPVYKQAAALQEERGAELSFEWAWRAEKIHAGMFRAAREAVLKGEDMCLGTVQICSACGHTLEGEAPECCPICGAPREKYVAFA